jgi:ubiquinone/menaquinone biosynthesis C-methylase UbiE
MLNSYDQIAEQWHANFRGQAYVDRVLAYVDRVLEGLPQGANVLDLGCGTGDPIAKYIVAKGYHVVGVDQSEQMLAIARQVVPEAELIQSDMISLQLTDKFAAAIAWDSIFHVDRSQHASVFQKLAAALEPGARLLLSAGGSAAECITSEMFGQTFSYSGHEPEVTRKLLEAAGFEIEIWEVDDPASRGHLAVIGRKMPQA